MANPMTQMWMGPRGNEMWFKPPKAGLAFTPVGWTAGNGPTQAIGGTANVRRSKNTHMDYPMEWGIDGREALSPLRDMYSGARGPGLIYFIDPMAADLNICPQQIAFPASSCYDAVPLYGDVRPNLVRTPDNVFGNPPESAQYLLTSTAVSRSVYFPIPVGYSAWVGVKGSITGTGGVRITPVVQGEITGTPFYPTMLSVTSAVRCNTLVDGTQFRGLVLDIANGTATSVILSAINIQILINGATPEIGNFIGGWGNSGCEFVEAPAITAYSSVLGPNGEGQVGAAAHLVEVGLGR